MQTLKFLGRGNAFNVTEGNTSAYIKNGTHLFLIDCGETVFEKLIKLKLLEDIESIDIVITHLHGDHVGSLSTLVFYLHFVKKIRANIYYPEPDKLLEILEVQCPHISKNKIDGCNYAITKVEEYDTFKINPNLSIGFVKTKHISYMNSYGILISYNDKNIYYSGDTSELEFTKYLYVLNEVYTDCTLKDYLNNPHLSFKKLSSWITKPHDREIIYLMHLDKELCELGKEYEGFKIIQVEE